jgi:hypothetical protein
VTLGLTTQIELDGVVRKAADKKAKDDLKKGILPTDALRPVAEPEPEPEVEEDVLKRRVSDSDVFANFGDDGEDDED